METGSKRWRQHLVQAWFAIALLYTSGHRKGWRKNVLHFSVCFIISLIFNTFLFLCLRYSMKYGVMLSGAIAGTCVAVVTTVLFFSKRVRCFGILFLISCGVQQGRNLLITAGTGLVVFRNVQNTFGNLKELARSMQCNLEKKSLNIDFTPLSNYINILKWVADQLKGFTDFGVVKYTSEFNVAHKTDSKEFREKLQQARRALNETAENMLFVMNTVSSVCQNVFPALGTILLFVFTALYLRKYLYNSKFKNTFITGKFIQYDEKQKAEGKPHVLPLTKKEVKRYIAIPSPRLSIKEGKVMLKFCIPVLTNLLIWVLLIGVDGLLYWFVLVIRKHLEQIEPFHVPLVMSVSKEVSIGGIPIPEDRKRKEDFSFSVALFEKECLPEPRLLLYQSVVPLAVILIFLVVLGLLSGKLTQLKLLVSAEFYGENADKRVQYLHAKILRGRSKTKLNDPRSVLKTLLKKTSFWFPIFFRHQKDDTVQLT
ncbi:hypothetical protein ANANG_G00014920 [Anguilla anguilla]|uniref:Dendritic cell-specific transmembrane protein-like domain-containing protein n=1 Tax=Anguilla anguilla TaxID=7936 RepID=A0A9D3MY80_ANGAN|nr:hypothetical protein ANANG_G00014920 [Anguilla anguilla]